MAFFDAIGVLNAPRHETRPVLRQTPDTEPGGAEALAGGAVPLAMTPRALGWTLEQLRRRKGGSAASVARKTGLVEQTVRDIELGRFTRYAYLNAEAMARELHGYLERALLLVRRFLWHDYQRGKRLHSKEPDWKYVYPWGRKRATPPRLSDAMPRPGRRCGLRRPMNSLNPFTGGPSHGALQSHHSPSRSVRWAFLAEGWVRDYSIEECRLLIVEGSDL